MTRPINNNFQEEDLEKSAPILFSLKRKMDSHAGLKIPEGYFENLYPDVMMKIEALPDFEAAEKVNPFTTPEGYFDALPTLIQQRINDQEKKKIADPAWIKEIFYKPAPKYALAFASLFLVLFFSIKYFTRTIKVEYVNSEPETEQLESFYLSQLDETVLMEAYDEEQVTAENSRENEIENYLIENNIDLNLISEHL